MPRKSKTSSNKKRSCKTKRCGSKTGGSLASNAVMLAVNNKAPGKDGYKTNMHLPPIEELKGGSRASKRLSSYMSDKSTEPRSELLQSNEFSNASMDGFNTQTYELTGGGVLKNNLETLIDAARKNPDVSPKLMVTNYLKGMPMRNKLTINQLISKNNMTGGSGVLANAGCGPVNVPDAGRKYADYFTKSSKCPGPEWFANPPNLGSAGSGLEDVGVGAPIL